MNLTMSSKLSALLEKRRKIKNSSTNETKIKFKQGDQTGDDVKNPTPENNTSIPVNKSDKTTTIPDIVPSEVTLPKNSENFNNNIKTSEISSENLIRNEELDLPDLPQYFRGWIKYSHYMENEKAKEFFKNIYFSSTKKSNDVDEVNMKL